MYFRLFVCLLLIALNVFNSCSKRTDIFSKNDLDQFTLKGKVKKLFETNYSESGEYTTTISFNKDGFILEQSSYNPDGSLIRKWSYQLDDKNRKINKRCYVRKDSLSYTLNYYYNEHGKLSSTKLIKADGIFYLQSILTYDKYQNKTKEINYGSTSKIESQVLSKYNKYNQITEESYLDSVLNQRWKQLYKYNQYGLREEITYVSMDNNLLKRISYKYDNSKFREVCFYNSDNKLVNTTSYGYNKLGDIVKTSEFDCNNKKKIEHTFKYKYDKHGNWTMLLGYINDSIESTMTRKLEYFE